VIAAAGSGQRLGAGGPKALVGCGGRPLIGWSLAAFAAASSIDEVVIAAPPRFEDEVGELAGEGVVVVAGGETRAESVSLAMEAVKGEVVAVHDAARPLVTAELIDRLVGRLDGAGVDGVIAAAPVADTLKLAGEGGSVQRTVDRSGLWGAQTPQVFRADALRAAQEAARAAGELDAATDEAWLIERAGGTVLLEATGAPNLKVTEAADLAVAEALLAGRR
jgi:2-C-methyl-D-erythritol 4-phosphate cytidylyltransferase